ncbi:MAG: FtsX-like permease family protein [Bacteroidota bacterium]
MLKNYLLISFRTIRRDTLHTLIKVLGLSVGIAACLTIYQLATYELSFDRSLPNKERIYRVYTQFGGNFDGLNPGVSTGLPADMKAGISGVKEQTHFYTESFPTVRVQQAQGTEKTLLEVDKSVFVSPDFFDVFSHYEWLVGSPQSALSKPFQVVLTDEQVRYYFGELEYEEVLGKSLTYQDSLVMTVSGVIKSFDKPTDLIFEDYLSFSTIEASFLKENIPLDNWIGTTNSSQLFVLLDSGVDPQTVQSQIDKLADPHREAYTEMGWTVAYMLQPFSNIHFNPEIGLFGPSRGATHLPTIYGILGIAALLLLIASINYINLGTAQAFRRGREVGVRKVLGSSRKMLIVQFLGETFLISLFSIVLAVILTELTFGFFKEFFPPELTFEALSFTNLLFYLFLAVLISLVAGLYPAFILSSFLPDRALKSTSKPYQEDMRNLWFRKGLIVLQFAVSIALIIATFLSSRQIHFLLNKELGFQKDAILTFTTPFLAPESQQELLKNELLRLPEVQHISIHNRPPASGGYNSSNFRYEKNGELTQDQLNVHRIDTNYLSVYEIPLLAGRNLLPSDTVKEYLVNEAFVRHAGYEQASDAVGKILDMDGVDLPIVGVVKDFHHKPLTQTIEPLLLGAGPFRTRFGLKLNREALPTNGIKGTLARIEQSYTTIYPNAVFNSQFYDEAIANFYDEEQRLSKLTRTATGIALFLSCMGLFGLISISVVQRTKEIGIRKVLGASVSQIVQLLSKEFLILVGVAFGFAAPIAYYFMNQWLSGFAYQIDLEWWVFLLAGGLTALIAFLTVSLKSVRAAQANPIEALRSE